MFTRVLKLLFKLREQATQTKRLYTSEKVCAQVVGCHVTGGCAWFVTLLHSWLACFTLTKLTNPTSHGPQFGYNLCNLTTEGPNSDCQTALMNHIDGVCSLWYYACRHIDCLHSLLWHFQPDRHWHDSRWLWWWNGSANSSLTTSLSPAPAHEMLFSGVIDRCWLKKPPYVPYISVILISTIHWT